MAKNVDELKDRDLMEKLALHTKRGADNGAKIVNLVVLFFVLSLIGCLL